MEQISLADAGFWVLYGVTAGMVCDLSGLYRKRGPIVSILAVIAGAAALYGIKTL